MLRKMGNMLLKLCAVSCLLPAVIVNIVGLSEGLNYSGDWVAIATVVLYSFAWCFYYFAKKLEGRPAPNPALACLPYLWCLLILLPVTYGFSRLLVMCCLLGGAIFDVSWYGYTKAVGRPKRETPKPVVKAYPKPDKPVTPAGAAVKPAATESDLKAFITKLRYARAKISDEALTRDVIEIEAIIADIDKNKELHNANSKAIQKVSSYYLPTALKLLRTYSDIESNLLRTEKSETIKSDIKLGISDIKQGFRELYNNMFERAAIDTSAELSVLKNRMTMDGMVNDFDSTPSSSNVLKQAEANRAEAELKTLEDDLLELRAELTVLGAESAGSVPPWRH